MEVPIDQKINGFFAAYPLRRYNRGQVIIRAGEPPDGVFYLVDGQVRQFDITDKGDEIVVNVFKQYSFFPMSWAINKTLNEYFFEAASDISVRCAPADQAVNFIKTNPDVMFNLLSRVYKGTDGLLRRIAHSMGGTARTRLMFGLVIETKRFGKQQKDGGYRLAISESELATRTGLARETVSREMQALKNAGLVKITPGGVTITNLEDLETTLGSSL